MKYVLLLLFPLLWNCTTIEKKLPKEGNWRAVLTIAPKKELPFNLSFNNDQTITIINADEKITLDKIVIKNDSITISHPVFEGIFKGTFSEERITGSFIKPSLDRIVPFEMIYGNASRFPKTTSNQNISGNWETVFSPDTPADRYIAKGIFSQNGNIVTGTFRTTTGDYRFLEGIIDKDSLKLSTFDGAHAFLFEAKITDSTMNGFFYSGNHWKEPFIASRNEDYELPDANDLTFLKEGYDSFDFSFPDSQGNMISITDSQFQNKVVVVQIMGTWCPNCLEETEYYVDYLNENPNPDLQFVSLAFEYAPTKEKAFAAINRLKDKKKVPYPILLAQYGSSDKGKANKKLPMLNHVLSYPTTVFLDKQGNVRKIHTGFNGKATGEKFESFKNNFEGFIAALLSE